MSGPDPEGILAECSDEEEFDKWGICKGSVWCPKLEEISPIYTAVKEGKIELDWKCPGRRDPNAVVEEVSPQDDNQNAGSDGKREPDDFAFEMEEEPVKPTKPGPMFKSKSNPKKTTTLAGILSNMERIRIIEKRSEGGNEPPTS